MSDDTQFASADEPPAMTEAEALAASATTTLRATVGMTKLYDPDHIQLNFGPHGAFSGDNIIIGQIEDHVAIVPSDHPLIADFLRFHPHAVQRDPGDDGVNRTWACSDCDDEFPTKAALKKHQASKHKPPKAPAAKPK